MKKQLIKNIIMFLAFHITFISIFVYGFLHITVYR